jgi:DNA repair exonuclease SbcCD nuclease subunit
MDENGKDIDFGRVLYLTDLHFGMSNNSQRHNQWCLDFIKWSIARAKELNIKTLIFGGDYMHNRANTGNLTLAMAHQGLKLISNYFDNSIWLLGNHDIAFRESRKHHSLPYIHDFKNIHLIDEITIFQDDFAFVPWLMEGEAKLVPEIKSKYMFGHFEIDNFRLNSQVLYEGHKDGLKSNSFRNQHQVFSGHFHARQVKGTVHYTGNCFPHNFSDANDNDRGIMIWTPGSEPVFESWPEAPKYVTTTLSQALENPSKCADNKTFIKITVDTPSASYEDLAFVKELFTETLGALEVSFVHTKNKMEDFEVDDSEIEFESVDSIVISHLQSIESTSMDSSTLINIYQSI